MLELVELGDSLERGHRGYVQLEDFVCNGGFLAK
jgi:hypothetical protein